MNMRRRLYALAFATFASSWVLLTFTAPGIPIVWDEGEYLFRAQRIIDWLRLRPLDFSRDAIGAHWLFINYSEGHPAGFALPIALGQWLAARFVDPLTAARLGPITLFSIACAAIAVRLKKDHGTAAAIVAPVTLLTFPRIFSEAHFATQDGQLTAWWLLLWAGQSSFAGGTGATVALGVVLGLTTATKFTGWLAWAPTIVSQAIQRNFTAIRRLAVIIPVALLTFYTINPPLWHDPIDALKDHFLRNLNRAQTLNISTLFFGQVYNVQNPLPWYNTLTWLMVVRALPGAPPHDGIRLFLPAFGFWCVFAGIGAQRAFSAITTIPAVFWRTSLRFGLSAALFANAATVIRYYPQTLSHYSLIAGGLRGAAEKGMEPAYWWDGLDNDVLSWLNQRTDPNEAIAFSPISNMTQLHEWSKLRPRDVDPEKEQFKWYVLQNRPGMFTRIDRALIRRETPVFVKYAGRRRAGAGVPRDLEVPLIWVFSSTQYQRARRR
jgi:hypothetical protein